MANPQPDKYFKFSIELFNALCKTRVNGEAMQIFNAIVRQTYGYHRKLAEIPTLKFMEMTGLGRQAVHKARKKLLDMNMIGVTQKGNTTARTYCIQKDYELWRVLPKKVTVTQKGNTLLPKKVTVRHQKGNSTDRNNNTGKGGQDPKDNIKDNIKDNKYYSQFLREIFDYWNSLGIIKHREMEKFKPYIKAKLENYSVEEIKEAMLNYSKILNSPNHWPDYKWDLEKFLTQKNAFDSYLTENNPYENFKRFESKKKDSKDIKQAITKTREQYKKFIAGKIPFGEKEYQENLDEYLKYSGHDEKMSKISLMSFMAGWYRQKMLKLLYLPTFEEWSNND